ncbi:MAG: 3'(2'),5'-bisphosphate nucleotidase CysQ [Candidatus Rokubacteria bacterium]|nr:3'(2'),5'-bisphosphate nucleotidase CysQ [Candidatus Rokubacteria bacterium]
MLRRVMALAREAGEAILAYYEGEIEAQPKSDGSPLTLADRAAHRIISDGLAALDPAIPVVSEEGLVPEYAVRKDWHRFWLVDPLDGSKEFIKHNGEFTVNIALIEHAEPVMGVIFAPALDLMYYAAKGGGAWKQEDGASPKRIFSSDPERTVPLTIVESRSHPSPALEDYLSTLHIARRLEVGSSLKFCWLAEGKADVYPRLGPTMEWDVAAGDCIYRNAARKGQNPSPLTYNKPNLRNDRFVVGLPRCGENSTDVAEAPTEP